MKNKAWKTFIELSCLLLIVTILVQIVFYVVGRKEYPIYTIITPLFFFLNGIILSRFVGKYGQSGQEPSLAKLTLLRMIKIIGGIIVLLIGLLYNKTLALPFVVEFVVYYLLYLGYETYVLYKLNKNVDLK